jgi:hypothetical protein
VTRGKYRGVVGGTVAVANYWQYLWRVALVKLKPSPIARMKASPSSVMWDASNHMKKMNKTETN